MKTSICIVLGGFLLVPVAAAAASGDQPPTGGIEEVIVTAERVESVASKTPLALTVLTGRELRDAGITTPLNLPDFVPNFSIDFGNNDRITIRGITSFDTSNKGDPSAAFLLDGVYIARSQDIDGAFFDLARVEVLSGPQGTLYGRNTTAGVVNVISNRPTDAFEAAANATVGNFGTFLTDEMVNMPFGDSFALRAAVSYERQDNYLRTNPGDPINLGLWRNSFSGRVQGLITLSDKANLLVKVDYRYANPDSTQVSVLTTNFFNVTNPTMPIYLKGGNSTIQRTLTYDQSIPSTENNNYWGVSAEFNWDLGPLVLTYLGSHRESTENEAFNFFFFAALGVYDKEHHTQNSHELRFATTDDGPFKAQFGVYYFDESAVMFEVDPNLGPPPLTYFGVFAAPTKGTSYAGFGQATYNLTDALHLTAGIRYTHDDKSEIGGEAFQLGRIYNPATDLLIDNNLAKISSSRVTWRVGVDYALDTNSLLYANVSTGYKSGGFNTGCLAGSVVNGKPCFSPVPASALFYQPETLTDYEIGAKLRLADNTLQVNADAFYYDYKNLQLQSITEINGAPAGEISNAGAATVKGVELASIYVPDEYNRLDATLTYLDGYYTNYFPLGAGVPPSFAGKSLDNSPHFTFAVGYTYTRQIMDIGSIDFNVYSKWSDSYVVSSFTVPAQFRQPSFTKTDLTLTYRPSDDGWYLQAFAKNLEDNIQITSVALDSVNITMPRTFGLRAGIKF